MFFSSFRFGVREGTLTCKSESGRTLFNAKLEDGEILESAEFIIDSSKNIFTRKDESYVILDPANLVYTVCLDKAETPSQKGEFLKFWAIPSTFKLILKEGEGSLPHEVYTFKAKVWGSEPRRGKGFEYNSKIIELNCTLDLE
jgi:hypothetical protein